MSRPGFVQRTRLRRRLRYLRHLRELQLRDLGGFTVELSRHGRSRPELVRGKIENALRTEQELRSLERRLTGRAAVREVREPAIGGICRRCGSVHGSADHFCSACGGPLRRPARA